MGASGDKLLFTITGPSGVGKTTINKKIVEMAGLGVKKVVTCTTRGNRPDEKDGLDYHFLTQEQFLQDIKNGEFLEFASVYGRYYGSKRKHVEEVFSLGYKPVACVDVQGAQSIKKNYHPNTSIFITTENVEELKKRLIERGADSNEEIERRLRMAPIEFSQARFFDYVVENPYGMLELAVVKVAEIIKREIQ